MVAGAATTLGLLAERVAVRETPTEVMIHEAAPDTLVVRQQRN